VEVLGVKVGDTATYDRTVKDFDMIAMFGVAAANPADRSEDRGMVALGLLAAVGMELTPAAPVKWKSLSLRFVRPAQAGDQGTARIEVTGVDTRARTITCAAECINQAGQQILVGETTLELGTG
jgi:hypothetical protein